MATDAAPFDLCNIFQDDRIDNDLHDIAQVIEASRTTFDACSRSTTPVPPDEHELLAMRTRALSLRGGKGKEREDSLISELADMVLRLTDSLPARSQLDDQAATIRRLSLQQDFLLKRMEDECASWDAERESTRRICEALIAQANIASHNLYKEQVSKLWCLLSFFVVDR